MRIRLALVALLAAGVGPVAAAPQAACADEGARAALVVDTGPDTYRLCVALPVSSVSGIELIELASEQHGLGYDLGFGGGAVCMLAGVGPTGDDCFADYPAFWGYWRGDGDGGWTWGSSGAGGTTVTDGDVQGWAWGEGDGPDTHPAPPATGFGDVCKSKPAAPPLPDPRPGRKDRGAPSSDAGVPSHPGSDEGDEPARREAPDRKPRDRRRNREEAADPVRAQGPFRPVPHAIADDDDRAPARLETEPASETGPPPAAVAAVLVALGLIATGAAVGRRRRVREGSSGQ